MLRRLTLLTLVTLVFMGAVYAIREVGVPALSSAIHKQEVKQFELVTDETESAAVTKEVLLSSPLIILGKSDATPFTPTQVVLETNRQRVMMNLPELVENEELAAAAEMKVRDMFEHQYFEHNSPLTGGGPDSLARAASYEYVSLGENLALGNFGDEAALVDAWMKSPGHRANILRSQFQEIGIAVGRGEYQGKQVLIAVQEFGRPLNSCPAVKASAKKSIEDDKIALAAIGEKLTKARAVIETLENDPKADDQVYQQKVNEYNTQIGAYNALVAQIKQKTTAYNAQVRAFNACLKTSS